MAIKISVQNSKHKSLFTRLQYLTFSNLVSRVEDKTHLDVESHEILFRLKDNVSKLSDLSSRMDFMMGEISTLIQKKS